MTRLQFVTKWSIACFLWFVCIWWLRDWDLPISQFFYRQETWLFQDQPFWEFVYRYSPILPVLLLFLSLLLLIFPSLQKYCSCRFFKISRHYILLYFLTGLLVSGFLINTLLKGYCGKPRPYEVAALGGKWDYQKTFDCLIAGKGASFPSGHVAAAALLFCICRLQFSKKRDQMIFLTFTCLYVILVALQRIGEGGHFLTDTLSAIFLVVWLHFAIERWLVPVFSHKKYQWFAWLVTLILLGIGVINRPLYLEERKQWQNPSQMIQIFSNLPLEKISFTKENSVTLQSIIQAKGLEGVIESHIKLLQCPHETTKIFYHVDWKSLTQNTGSSLVLLFPKNTQWIFSQQNISVPSCQAIAVADNT